MRTIATVFAAAGVMALIAIPASARTEALANGVQNKSGVETTEFSSQHRHWRHRHYGYRRYYGPRRYYGYRGPRYWDRATAIIGPTAITDGPITGPAYGSASGVARVLACGFNQLQFIR